MITFIVSYVLCSFIFVLGLSIIKQVVLNLDNAPQTAMDHSSYLAWIGMRLQSQYETLVLRHVLVVAFL